MEISKKIKYNEKKEVSMGVIFWLIAACILAGIEIIVPALITIWFALAALVLTTVSFLFPLLLWNPLLEWKIFIILSIVLLILTRPFCKKYLSKRKGNFYANFVGSDIEVTKVIRPGYYEGKLKGATWTLISEDDSIQEGEKVQIVSYEGNRIIVKKKEA